MKDGVLPISVGLGTAIGLALSNIPMGVAVGAALGVILEMFKRKDG